MYIRLRLKNWRSIDDATVVIAPFTVIVGRNSSGKSNVVDALLFCSEIARDAQTAVARRGGITSIRRWSQGRPYDVTLDVRVASGRDQLETDHADHEVVIRSGKDGAWRFIREQIALVAGGETRALIQRSRSSVEYNFLGEQMSGESIAALPETTSAMVFAPQLRRATGPSTTPVAIPRWLSSVRAIRPVPELMRQPQPPAESARLTQSAENITSALHKLSKAQRQDVVAAMQRIIPGLVDIQALSAGRYLTLAFTQAHGSDRSTEFAATEMSDGALRALAVIVAAQQMGGQELLIIEEPEVNLHPGAADVVYDVLHRASSRGAVLVTTHSPELLDRAKDDEILVCEYVNGVTKIGPLSSAQRDLVREGLFSAAELMRSEELRREGAAPRVVAD